MQVLEKVLAKGIAKDMHSDAKQTGASLSRVCVFSTRSIEAHVSRACGYEFEDVIARDLDDAWIFSPYHKTSSRQGLEAYSRLLRRTMLAHRPAFKLPKFDQDVDLFFISIAQFRDLSLLGRQRKWRIQARFAVCWLQELWAADIPRAGRLLDVLNTFDHVICPFYHSTEPLRQRLQVPVTYMPWGIDALGFCPFPDPPPRVIDAYNIGGISETTHEAMVDQAEASGRFYLHDTTKGRRTVASHMAHRRNYGSVLKRTKYFFSHKAKVLRRDERGAQEEFGLRYLEGIAAGAVLLGDRVENPAFEEHLGWPDSVIQIPYDCPNIGAVIEELERQPERIEAARRANMLHALRQHDHLYRWETVLELAGLEPSPKLAARRTALEARAREIEAADSAATDGMSAA